MKILSDFDGVWTSQLAEAQHATSHLVSAAALCAGFSVEESRDHFEGFLRSIETEPSAYGWAPDGRITAFVDEDPLLQSSSLACFLERAADPLARRYREAILDGDDATVPDFGNRCFIEATSSFRDEHPPLIVDGAREALDAWHAAGAEVVIVSNSGPDKIIAWLRHAGIDAGEEKGHRVRVRGNARKWEIGGDEQHEHAGRSIYIDRPRYRAAILEEAPDLIVGDVFSLDLALPYVMRQRGEPAPSRLVLRRHDHTPDWVLSAQGKGIDAMVEGLEGIVPLIEA